MNRHLAMVSSMIPLWYSNITNSENAGLGIGACLVSFAILIVLVLVMGFYLHWQNKRRQSDRSTSEAAAENVEFFDSDQTNPGFVYVY
jgi:uncharacterized protein HemX